MRKSFCKTRLFAVMILAAVLLLSAGCSQNPASATTATTGAQQTESSITSPTSETVPTTVAAESSVETGPETTASETAGGAETSQETTGTASETTRETTTAATTATIAETSPPAPVATLSIECHRAVEAGIAGAPADGIILAATEIEIADGETVWDVLYRVSREKKIVVNKVGSGGGLLVTGINGIAMTGAKSGWIYSVNDEVPGISAGAYELKPGDVIRWQYTLDSGNDL